MNVVRKLHHYLVLPHPGTRESICIYFNFVLDPWFGSGAPPLEGMIPGPTGSSERVASVSFLPCKCGFIIPPFGPPQRCLAHGGYCDCH